MSHRKRSISRQRNKRTRSRSTRRKSGSPQRSRSVSKSKSNTNTLNKTEKTMIQTLIDYFTNNGPRPSTETMKKVVTSPRGILMIILCVMVSVYYTNFGYGLYASMGSTAIEYILTYSNYLLPVWLQKQLVILYEHFHSDPKSIVRILPQLPDEVQRISSMYIAKPETNIVKTLFNNIIIASTFLGIYKLLGFKKEVKQLKTELTKNKNTLKIAEQKINLVDELRKKFPDDISEKIGHWMLLPDKIDKISNPNYHGMYGNKYSELGLAALRGLRNADDETLAKYYELWNAIPDDPKTKPFGNADWQLEHLPFPMSDELKAKLGISHRKYKGKNY